eukprot:GHVS01094389.1.p1 GENE.GHVS01094389.1~~GHVS01094389.1.p1  ORF type:complete len:114 (+),score=23.29 GHVS01094389.1:104-445(+)
MQLSLLIVLFLAAIVLLYVPTSHCGGNLEDEIDKCNKGTLEEQITKWKATIKKNETHLQWEKEHLEYLEKRKKYFEERIAEVGNKLEIESKGEAIAQLKAEKEELQKLLDDRE